MPAKVTDKTEARTSKIRLEMLRLMEQEGLSENEALARALPEDRNRTKKLRRWKQKGLWPLSSSGIGSSKSVNSDIHSKSETGELSEKDLLQLIRALLDTIEPAERPIGATAKGRKSPLQTTMIAVRIPATLDEALQALGGPKSRHVERALMLYVRAMKEEETYKGPDAWSVLHATPEDAYGD